MNDTPNTFERLVLTLESSQRQEMLRQLAEISEVPDDDSAPSRRSILDEAGETVSPEKKLLEEPFLVRLWFIVLALFTSGTPSRLYSEHLVTNLGKKLDAACGRYIDTRHGYYTDEFYQEIFKLKKTQIFFSALLTGYENDKGGFSIILSSLLMKKTYASILKTADPFSVPINQELKKDIRLLFIREMDSIFLAIPEDERYQMYQAIQAVEWLRNFCTAPLERILARFGAVPAGVKPVCMIDTIEAEVKDIVHILHSAKKIPVLLLEALYLFSVQDKMDDEKFDMEKECASFVATAAAHLSEIRQFKSALYLADFVRFTIRDVTWQPAFIECGEDWFVLFKNACKKRFDEKWNAWNRLHRRAMLEKNICAFLERDESPVLAAHPWYGMWVPLVFRRELSLCFLKGLFNIVYPSILMKPLKILLIDGDFYRRENMMEFTDAFSTLEHMQQQIETFEHRLSAKGDIGEGFALINKEMVATVKGKARLDNLMLSIESDAEHLIGCVKASFRAIDLILGGVLGVVRGGPYETLVNMAAIQGKQNEKYRKELENVRQVIRNAAGILSDAEVIEKEAQ
jgi:hypothetical protein